MKHEDIIGAEIKRFNDLVNRQVWGDHYAAYANPQPGPALTYARLKETFDYCKPEHITINGERHEIGGFKVHRDESIPEGVIVMTEKPKLGSGDVGKTIILFTKEGKGVIYDPAKVRPPAIEMPRVVYGFGHDLSVMQPPAYIPQARKIVAEKWPELIAAWDDFFEVFDLIDGE